MVKMAGAICVLLGFLLPVVQRTRRERTHLRQLGALAESLDVLRRQMIICAPAMEELLAMAGQSSEEEVSQFYASLRLDELGDVPFSLLWEQAARQLCLEGEEWELFSGVGQVLGRCDREEQCARLETAAEGLRRCRRERDAALRQGTRMWYVLSASAGLLMALVLC